MASVPATKSHPLGGLDLMRVLAVLASGAVLTAASAAGAQVYRARPPEEVGPPNGWTFSAQSRGRPLDLGFSDSGWTYDQRGESELGFHWRDDDTSLVLGYSEPRREPGPQMYGPSYRSTYTDTSERGRMGLTFTFRNPIPVQ